MDESSQLPQVQASGPNAQVAHGPNSGVGASGQAVAVQSQPSEPSSENGGVSELDREYIDKTISAVDSNSDDPYAQSKAINQIRSDYLSGKFGKQINSST